MIGAVEEEIIGASFAATFADVEVIPHAVGFMPDHVHIAASIPPKIAVADVVRRLKGASTRAVNLDPRRKEAPRFGWQDDYGVLSFGEKALPDVVAYVANQPERHRARTHISGLERTTDPT